MALTDIKVRTAKPTDKQYKLTDGNGMHLLVHPNGSKYWRLQYRFDGKQKMLALGVYPEITLADARSRRDEARKLLANGVDPGDKKKSDKYGKNKFDVVTSGQRTNYFYYIVPKGLIKPDEVPDFAGLIYAYEGSVQCYSLEKGRYAVKRIFFEVAKPAQKVSDMKADDNFIRKLDLSMYYRYHQMRRDNYKNKE